MEETTQNEATPQIETAEQEETTAKSTPESSPSTTLFPHETPSEHWDIDYNDTKQSYQGTDLPIWILVGWAAFIIWAVIYLISGLPTAF